MGRAWRPVIIELQIAAVVGVLTPLNAQWFTYPSSRAPRTASGSVDLSAAAPRLTNGQPDLSGVWMTGEPACVIRGTTACQRAPQIFGEATACERQPATKGSSGNSCAFGRRCIPAGCVASNWSRLNIF